MSNIPDDIKQKIHEAAKLKSDTSDEYQSIRYYLIYGYDLALPKIEELEKEIERLKKENEELIDLIKRHHLTPIT
jgi:hypothetical protein